MNTITQEQKDLLHDGMIDYILYGKLENLKSEVADFINSWMDKAGIKLAEEKQEISLSDVIGFQPDLLTNLSIKKDKEKKLFYTDKEVEKLKDCEVLIKYNEWRAGYKFLKRSRVYITVLFLSNNKWITTKRHCSEVKVNNVILEYIPRYSFTNPKNPFKTVY